MTITMHLVTEESWYEHTDGSYGFYVIVSGTASCTRTVDRAELCVTRDDRGLLLVVGWPAAAALLQHGLTPRELTLREADRALCELLGHCERCGNRTDTGADHLNHERWCPLLPP